MRYLRESAFLRAVVLPFALVFWLSACHKWVDLEPPYGPAIESAETGKLRLTVAGERIVPDSATLRSDTLWLESTTLRNDTVLVNVLPVPLTDLEAVEVRKANIPASIGVAILGAAIFVLAACYENDCISPGLGN